MNDYIWRQNLTSLTSKVVQCSCLAFLTEIAKYPSVTPKHLEMEKERHRYSLFETNGDVITIWMLLIMGLFNKDWPRAKHQQKKKKKDRVFFTWFNLLVKSQTILLNISLNWFSFLKKNAFVELRKSWSVLVPLITSAWPG